MSKITPYPGCWSMISFSRYQTRVKRISERLILQTTRYLDGCSDPLWSFLAQPRCCPSQLTMCQWHCRTAPGQRFSLGHLHCTADEEEAGSGTGRTHLLQPPEPLWPAGGWGLDTHPSAALHRMFAVLAGHSPSCGAAGAEADIHILTRWNYSWGSRGTGERNEVADFMCCLHCISIPLVQRKWKCFVISYITVSKWNRNNKDVSDFKF